MAKTVKETAQAAGIDLSKVNLEAGRRAFMQSLGLGAAGIAALGVAGIASTPALAAVTDADIANFALNLEYVEAEFYLRAATGAGLAASDIGPNPGPVTGGRKVNFRNALIGAYAREIATDEQNHVKFLRSVLGSAAVSRPALDIGPAFATAAQAAGLGAGFDAYANDTSFLLAAYIFEDVGVTAYNGAAPLIADKTILSYAASILAIEAYHAGLIRTVLFANGASRETALISNLRATLDGTAGTPNVDDAGVGVVSNPNIVLADRNSLAFQRTTRQVLNIVYGAQNATRGLFFPNGLNGTIKA